MLASVLIFGAMYNRAVHVLKVSGAAELERIRAAKGSNPGSTITCSARLAVLFPAEGAVGAAVLWAATDVIDMVVLGLGDSDDEGTPCFESALPKLLGAVREGRITLAKVAALLSTNPRAIFHLDSQPETHIEVDDGNGQVVEAVHRGELTSLDGVACAGAL